MDKTQRDIVRGNPYHGIIVDISQRDRAIFKRIRIIGRKRVFPGLVILYKVEVGEEDIRDLIRAVRKNMADRVLFKKQEFYAHFYRDDELIIVFREKTFTVSTDRHTWSAALEYGKSLRISEKQLDFIPNRVEDERY